MGDVKAWAEADQASANDSLLPGLSTYKPVPATLSSMKSPAVISGNDFHNMLQISLAPGDVMTAQPGTMVMLSAALRPRVATGGCGQACRRCCCAGEPLFRLEFENKTNMPQYLSIAPPGPGKIIPLDLTEWAGVTLSSGVFVGAYGRDWKYEIGTVGNVGTACCGGQGVFLPRLTGSGLAFIYASGCVEVMDLKDGEQIVVDQANVVAYSKGVKFDVRTAGSCWTCCCGGMGFFNAIFTGPGKVIVESLPMQKLAATLYFAAQGGGGGGAAAA